MADAPRNVSGDPLHLPTAASARRRLGHLRRPSWLARTPERLAPTSAPWRALREGEGAPDGGDRPDHDSLSRTEDKPKRVILCAACHHEITDADARIERAGRHQHTCVNPAGFVYRIGCFRAAPGCATTGGWSAHYSWFAGYVWQVACCAACSMHLGWAFEAERLGDDLPPFWGLILDRITEGT